MKTTLRCQAHRAPAGWQCSRCEALLCPDCTISRRVSNTTIEVCTRCGELADRLMRPRAAAASYLRRLAGALRYPLEDGNLVGIVLVAIALLLLKQVDSTVWAIAGGAGFGGFFLIVRRSSSGQAVGWNTLVRLALNARRERADGKSRGFPGLADGLATAMIRGLLATLWWLIPLWLYVDQLKVGNAPLRADPVFWLLALLGLLFLPIALLAASTHASLGELLNPVRNFRYLRVLGNDYLWSLLALLGCAAVAVPLPLLAARVHWVPMVLLLKLLAACVEAYGLFLAPRILGLLLYVRGGEIGYGRPEDFRDPLLPDVEPRAADRPRSIEKQLQEKLERGRELPPAEAEAESAEQLAARRAPIELPDEPQPAAPEPRRVAPTELDASALPSAEALFAQLLTGLVHSGDVLGALDAWRHAPRKPPPGVSGQTLLTLGESALQEDDRTLAAEILAAAASDPRVAGKAGALLARCGVAREES